MPEFYFAYGYNLKQNIADKLCRHIDGQFQTYKKNEKKWVNDNELSRIFIGEDIYYDEISEEQAEKIIKNLEK